MSLILICFVTWKVQKIFIDFYFLVYQEILTNPKTSDKWQIDGLPIWIGAGKDELSELNSFSSILSWMS